MGTPTATPPKWLIDRNPDILPVDAFGTGPGLRLASSLLVLVEDLSGREPTASSRPFARRYGRNEAVAGWQTDNEYGCHNTVLSWGAEDLDAFHSWLRRRYQTPDALNDAWGNVFWSQEVRSFDEIALPTLAVTETNPAARLDFRRFASEQVAAYDRMQVEILRTHSPGRFITHNFMGFFREFDHWAFDHLDLASWDSYPLGFVEQFPFSEAERERWALTSHPDIAAFHHDLYRGRRPRPVLGNGAATRARELGFLESRSAPGHGAPLDMGGLRPWSGGRQLFPVAASAFRAGADACRPEPPGPDALTWREGGDAGRA